MKYLGAHVSAANGVFNAPLNARQIGAKAFALIPAMLLQPVTIYVLWKPIKKQ